MSLATACCINRALSLSHPRARSFVFPWCQLDLVAYRVQAGGCNERGHEIFSIFYMSIHIYIYAHTRPYTHIHTHVHKHTRTHTHTSTRGARYNMLQRHVGVVLLHPNAHGGGIQRNVPRCPLHCLLRYHHTNMITLHDC